MTATKRSRKDIIEDLVRRLRADYGTDATGHDWFHLERVWKMAVLLAKSGTVDRFVIEMAALLHDVDDFKFKKPGESPTAVIDRLLALYDIDGETKRKIVGIAMNVSFKGAGVPDNQPTPEGQIVQDADRLDAMGALGIARTFMYSGSVGRLMYDPEAKPTLHSSFNDYKKVLNTKTAINHFYEKLLRLKDRLHTEKAKRIAEKRHRYMKGFLREFFREIEEAKP